MKTNFGVKMLNAKELLIKQEDTYNNPSARIAVCLCLDTSTSMQGEAIRELNAGIELFFDAIKNDETAKYAAEICIVTFDSSVKCLLDFSNIERVREVPKLTAEGNTFMGEGVMEALRHLEGRKLEYQDLGVDYYQPWLVLMTDGEPNGDEHVLEQAIAKTVGLINTKKLTMFPIAIGKHANIEVLKKISPNRKPLILEGLKFREFFSWLSRSVSTTSQSIPGERIPLPPIGWGNV